MDLKEIRSLDMKWIHVAQDMDYCWAPVNKVMDFRYFKK